MDIRALKRIKDVARVVGNPNLNEATLVYFLCPCLSSKGIVVNQDGTGFTAKYVERLSVSAKVRINKARGFMAQVSGQSSCVYRIIWGSADGMILYSQSDFPAVPDGLRQAIANHSAVASHMVEFWRFYEERPWTLAPAWAVVQEERRLLSILPADSPKALQRDFIRRVFAGFALDGWLLREGLFGPDPVILGVESSGVAILQNAALALADQIPVIQLK